MSLSLDVLYHLVEDAVFEQYMHDLFASSLRFVSIYSSNTDDNEGYMGSHVFHRTFTEWIRENEPGWELLEHIPNCYPYEGDSLTGSFADFYIFATS